MRWDDRRFYVVSGTAAALLAMFGLLANRVLNGVTDEFDQAFVLRFRDPDTPALPIGPSWFTEAVRDITALGSFSVLGLLVLGVVLHLLFTGSIRNGVLIAVSVVSGTIISTLLKAIFDRPRPQLTGLAEVFTSSFPSGHAAISAVVYLTIGVLLAERARTLPARLLYLAGAVFLTVIVGLTRLYLGVHFPTDILAGWALGGAWALTCLAFAHALRMRGQLKDTANGRN